MTQLLDCTIYYSVVGERFQICDRNTDPNLVKTKALIGIFSEKQEPVIVGTPAEAAAPLQKGHTRLKVLQEVKGGPFYASATHCIIVNGKNQILKLGRKYHLEVNMYRSLNDPNLFSIIFKDKTFADHPDWISF